MFPTTMASAEKFNRQSNSAAPAITSAPIMKLASTANVEIHAIVERTLIVLFEIIVQLAHARKDMVEILIHIVAQSAVEATRNVTRTRLASTPTASVHVSSTILAEQMLNAMSGTINLNVDASVDIEETHMNSVASLDAPATTIVHPTRNVSTNNASIHVFTKASAHHEPFARHKITWEFADVHQDSWEIH
jgi:hypothetical protein